MKRAMVLAAACTSQPVHEEPRDAPVAVEIVDPEGNVHRAEGVASTLVAPFTGDVSIPYSADGALTRDPSTVLGASEASVPHRYEAGLRRLRRAGNDLENYFDDHVHAVYSWPLDMTSMRVVVHDGATTTVRVHGDIGLGMLERYLGRIVIHSTAGGNLLDFVERD